MMLDFETCQRLKKCTKCGVEKPISEFAFWKSQNAVQARCRDCENARCRAWFQANRDKAISSRKAWQKANPLKCKERRDRTRRRLKMLVLRSYSGHVPACACCNETSVAFLCIDHVHGGGRKHFKEISINGGGAQFYAWLKKNKFPLGFQVLCFNCNMGKSFFGVCPHKEPVDHLFQSL